MYLRFQFCIGDKKDLFKKFIIKDNDNNTTNLIIGKEKKIGVNNGNKFVDVDYIDTNQFIKFVMTNKLNCGFNHDKCCCGIFFDEFVEQLAFNDLTNVCDISIIKDYVNFLHSKTDYTVNQSIINEVCLSSTLETVKFTLDLVYQGNMVGIIYYICDRTDEEFTTVFRYAVDLYCDRFKKYFKGKCRKSDFFKMYLPDALETVIMTDNVEALEYFIDMIPDTINNVNVDKIPKKFINVYNKIQKTSQYGQKQKDSLLLSSLANNRLIIADYLINTGADINKVNDGYINCYFKMNDIKAIEFLIEKGYINQDKINKKFTMCYRYNWRIVELLVNNGAQYDHIIDKLITKADNYGNVKLVKYLRSLKEE